MLGGWYHRIFFGGSLELSCEGGVLKYELGETKHDYLCVGDYFLFFVYFVLFFWYLLLLFSVS